MCCYSVVGMVLLLVLLLVELFVLLLLEIIRLVTLAVATGLYRNWFAGM
jgi:hypothetical protein